jgi:hypothetical protein
MSVTPYRTSFLEPGALGASIRLLTKNVTGFQPDSEPSWRARVAGLLNPLRAAFAAHRAATEGATGLYAEVVQDAPRLARTVDGLVEEHATLDGAMARLARIASSVESDAEALRHEAMVILAALAQHRQRDSDLVYDAYTTDIGGE